MTDWVEQADWGTVKKGDRVRLTKQNGDEAIFKVLYCEPDSLDSDHNWFSTKDGWTLFVESAPEPALPTEVGVYEDKDGGLWRIVTEGGVIFDPTDYEELNGDPRKYAPFTRLESQSETARKVLERIRAEFPDVHTRTVSTLADIAAEFGVTS